MGIRKHRRRRTSRAEARGLLDWGTDITSPDFSALAKACGAVGITVTEPGQLDDAMQQALDADALVVLDVCVDPDVLIMPPKIEFGQAMSFGKAKIRELFGA